MNAAKVCRKHGGGAPQVRAAAARRVAQQEAAGRVAALVKLYEAERPFADIDPVAELLRMLARSVVVEKVTAWLIERDLGDDWLREVSYGVQGRRLEIHPLLKYWHEIREQVAKFAKAAIDAGVEERRISMTEEVATMLATVIRGAVYAPDLKLEPWQQQRLIVEIAKPLPAA